MKMARKTLVISGDTALNDLKNMIKKGANKAKGGSPNKSLLNPLPLLRPLKPSKVVEKNTIS